MKSKTCAVSGPRNSGSILFTLRQQHTGTDSGGAGAYPLLISAIIEIATEK